MQNLPQKQVFVDDLTSNEKAVVAELIQSNKNNPAQLQQLAIDASHLLSNSEQRLAEQKTPNFSNGLQISSLESKQKANEKTNPIL